MIGYWVVMVMVAIAVIAVLIVTHER